MPRTYQCPPVLALPSCKWSPVLEQTTHVSGAADCSTASVSGRLAVSYTRHVNLEARCNAEPPLVTYVEWRSQPATLPDSRLDAGIQATPKESQVANAVLYHASYKVFQSPQLQAATAN